MSETYKSHYDLAVERMKRYVADAVVHNGKDSCQDTSVVTIAGDFYKISVTMSRVPKPLQPKPTKEWPVDCNPYLSNDAGA